MKTYQEFMEQVSATRSGRALGKMSSSDRPQSTKAMSSGGSGQRGGMTMTPVTSIGGNKTFKNNPDGDDMVKSMYDEKTKSDRKSAAKERSKYNKLRSSIVSIKKG